ncbi:hypothetical protein EZS27_030335 [termite gut metagenome]|uniref:Type II toxin-antitoxin system HicA family toxin n=1 Tax=termite gut metagenome TaxID=433724 RepID=A0A5J4QE94_9ZZZZ
MGTRDKLIKRFINQPKDFTFDELSKLLKGFGFEISNKGKTSGSRIRFINIESKSVIDIHKPHPGNIIKEGTLKAIYEKLISSEFIDNVKKEQNEKEED